MNWNLVRSIYGRSSLKSAHFVMIHYQTWPSTGNSCAFYQVSVHLARQFQRRRCFRYRPIRNKNCLWWPCLLTDQDEMSTLHRRHSTDASCHVTHQQNELKLSRKHVWKVLSKECTFCYDPLPNMALHRQFLFLIGQFFFKSPRTTDAKWC
jgi:hypothetical protein